MSARAHPFVSSFDSSFGLPLSLEARQAAPTCSPVITPNKQNWYRLVLGIGTLALTTNLISNSPTISSSGSLFTQVRDADTVFEKRAEIETVGKKIDKITNSLKLSKVALAEILGISRQTIYDWIAGRNELIKNENITKIEWLERLSGSLDSDARSKLWLWKSKKLSNGYTVFENLRRADVPPNELAKLIGSALSSPREMPKLALQTDNKRDLLDKSSSFTNYD